MKIARVFPRKTQASPDDELTFFGDPPKGTRDIDEVHISVLFKEDVEIAEKLSLSWKNVAPIKMGGVALGSPGGEFVPGMYVKKGYTITSRGCPNHCWFCDVWKREGQMVRELEIKDGHNVLDSNLLACSDNHIKSVFAMLARQKERAQFTGGLEAARLQWWHVELLWDLRPSQMFFAYDTADDYEPLIVAGKMLRDADFTRRHLRCYVLIGYRGDSIVDAKYRLLQTWKAGFLPMAMLWSDKDRLGVEQKEWEKFQRLWARPAITKSLIKQILCMR